MDVLEGRGAISAPVSASSRSEGKGGEEGREVRRGEEVWRGRGSEEGQRK